MISIIIASKNRYHHLENLLRDISCQDLQPVEVLVIDQSDQPYSLSSDDNVFHIPDNGPCRARNIGLSNCKGDIIIFLDDDIRIGKEFVSTLTKPITEENYSVVVGAVCDSEGRYPNESASSRFTKGRNWLLTLTSNPDFPGRYETLSFPAGCAAITREVYETIGDFDTFFDPDGAGEDREYAIRIFKAGFSILYEGNAKINHLGASTGGRRDSASKFKRINILDANCAYIVMKHFNINVFEQYCRAWVNSFLPSGNINPLHWIGAFKKRKEAITYINNLRSGSISSNGTYVIK